jgi:fatty-acyl-CoA synthase
MPANIADGAPYKYNLNFRNVFRTPEELFGDKEIVYLDRRVKYREFFSRVRRVCGGLGGIGVQRGDVVGVLDWDTMAYMELYFAVPMYGAVLHTVNIRYPPELIYMTMAHAGDKYVVIRDEFVPLVDNYASLFDFVKGWIIASDSGRMPETKLSPAYNYEDLAKGPECDPPDLDEDTWATIFYTSGTTGMPKGVTFTQRNLVMHTLALVAETRMEPLSLTEDDVIMSLVPMFHVHSWGIPYVSILMGSKYVLPGRYDWGRILELIGREGVTFSTMVPSILYMILTHPRVEEYADALRRWKVVLGGAATPRGLATMARKYGITVIGGYGLSETCPVLTIAVKNEATRGKSYDEVFDQMISTGVPIPMAHVRVVGPDGRDVPHDGATVGEIVARAPWLTSGYYMDPERTRELWRDGWLHTGDLAVVDPMGYIHIVDRERDAIKSGGEFIPTLVVENLISEVPGVGEVAIVGRPDPKWGERPVAFVVRRGQVSESDIIVNLQRHVDAGRIQKWWIPDQIIFIDEMPRTSTNKVDKKELRRRLGAGSGE